MSNTPYPNYEDTMHESREIAALHPGLATYTEIGKSEEDRPLPLLTITDPGIPAAHKSVFLLSGGTDGSEEVGRAVALGLARALLEPQHRTHLQRQVVLVAPVTNPDGCVRNHPDKAGNARGVPATEVHLQDRPPATAEGRAMRAFVEEWIPDAHIDFHGLAGGGMGDCAFLYPTVNAKWSIPILMEVEMELEEAGARAGFPQQGRPRLWWEPRYNLPGWLARNYSSFCMVVEARRTTTPSRTASSRASFACCDSWTLARRSASSRILRITPAMWSAAAAWAPSCPTERTTRNAASPVGKYRR